MFGTAAAGTLRWPFSLLTCRGLSVMFGLTYVQFSQGVGILSYGELFFGLEGPRKKLTH